MRVGLRAASESCSLTRQWLASPTRRYMCLQSLAEAAFVYPTVIYDFQIPSCKLLEFSSGFSFALDVSEAVGVAVPSGVCYT